jgi:hypothetical protein
MKRAMAPCLVTILVASGVGNRPLYAQIGYSPLSIEWLTASSDVVAVASVADLASKDRTPEPGETRSQWQWVTVTLKVRATLKGKARKTVVFVVERPRGDDTFSRWKESGQSVLWFLQESGDKKEELPPDFPALPKGQPRLRKFSYGQIVLGSPMTGKRVPQPVFSMDFSVLDEEDKIIEAVKAAVARRDKAPARLLWIRMPYEVAARSGKAGDANQLGVPVNSRLEELGRGWVGSKEAWLREASVQALAPFKSEANAAILKRLLDDKASWIETKDGRQERVYHIREAAYKTLQEWKVAVPQPLLREPAKEEL